MVTGGGGSIGAEICDRVITFGAARLLIIENSEPALHAVLETLATKQSEPRSIGRIADVRDRDANVPAHGRLQAGHRVPRRGAQACAAARTRTGKRASRPTCSARSMSPMRLRAAGAAAMVMISTDKAIEPVSMLGATKRFAEMYCQALDADFSRHAGAERRADAADRGAVRQRARLQRLGGAEVQGADRCRRSGDRHASRYGALLHDHSRGLRSRRHGGKPRARRPTRSDVSVYVLNMGQPVKIVDLAERMIRLAGLEPGRDIDIVFTGARPGERMQEILFAREEPMVDIGIVGVVAARPVQPSIESMRGWLAMLDQGLHARGARGDLPRAARSRARFPGRRRLNIAIEAGAGVVRRPPAGRDQLPASTRKLPPMRCQDRRAEQAQRNFEIVPAASAR